MRKLKILIVNKFLYPRGGDCICALNLRDLLEKNGHKVSFFSMEYPKNIDYPESKYFAKEVSFEGGIKEKLKAISRMFGGIGVKKNFEKLLDDFQPDVVHLNNIHSYLSPAIAQLAYKRKIKVIWTLHDYKLICPSYACLCQGRICESCFQNKFSVITRKCMKNNLFASILAWSEALWWNSTNLCRWIDTFICPSQFMAEKMIIGGYPKEKLVVLCNFIDNEKVNLIHSIVKEREKSYCYIGRLSKEKGVEALLAVAATLPYKLYIAGDGPQASELKEKYNLPNIYFVGQLSYKDIIAMLKKVRFSVLPSVWYENNPLSIIESLCCGTPVLGSQIGGIPELLIDPYSRLFTLNKKKELRTKIIQMFEECKEIDNEQLSQASLSRFSGKKYFREIMHIYQNSLE